MLNYRRQAKNMTDEFVWTDLSTLDIEEAKRFYKKCFGWNFQDIGEGYLTCAIDQKPAAGIYTMPEKFQRIGMPSFWMSYIHVPDINETVRMAEAFGASIEIRPQAGPGGGLIALIRDPAGAGFTCYEGEDLDGKDKTGAEARMVWNELHVSDLARVETFYTNVFGWEITRTDENDRYDIHNSSGDLIAGIRIYENEIKGDKEYWSVYFSVANIQSTTEQINRAGGEVVVEQALGPNTSVLAYDSQGAAFFLLDKKTVVDASAGRRQSTIKWRALFGLCLVFVSVVFEAMWIWGILFLIWIIPDIKSGSTHFLEHVERRRNPIVYWLILGTWFALSLYLLAGLFVNT